MASYFGSFTCSVDNVFIGLANKRELTALAYVEFSNNHTRNLLLKKLNSQVGLPSCTYLGRFVAVTPAYLGAQHCFRLDDLVKKYALLAAKRLHLCPKPGHLMHLFI